MEAAGDTLPTSGAGSAYYIPCRLHREHDRQRLGRHRYPHGDMDVQGQYRAWAMNPLINDADVRAQDAAGNVIGWRESPNEFDVVSATCTTSCATPQYACRH